MKITSYLVSRITRDDVNKARTAGGVKARADKALAAGAFDKEAHAKATKKITASAWKAEYSQGDPAFQVGCETDTKFKITPQTINDGTVSTLNREQLVELIGAEEVDVFDERFKTLFADIEPGEVNEGEAG